MHIRKCLPSDAHVSFKGKTQTDKVYLGDLSLVKTRTCHYYDSFHLNNEESFVALRHVFGRNFGIAVSKNFNMVKDIEIECPCTETDILNVVGFQNFNAYSYTVNKGQPPTPPHIIDRKNGNHVTLLYDFSKKIISVSVAFTKVHASGNTDGDNVMKHV